MKILGNIIWFIFGGVVEGILWVFFGLLCSATIIGIPIGKQCFKIAGMQFAPFGKEIVEKNDSPLGLIANIIWILLFGWELALANLVSALIFGITIIGIPFAKQSLKLAWLSLMPFGKDVVKI